MSDLNIPSQSPSKLSDSSEDPYLERLALEAKVDLKELQKTQYELASKVEIPLPSEGFYPSKGDLILSLDIQYVGERAHVGADFFRWGEELHENSVQTFAASVPATFPYIPGYFCFREGPPLVVFLERLISSIEDVPALVIIDGHGIAHPRRFGVASWFGVHSGLPTIGSAKRALIPSSYNPRKARGSTCRVSLNGEHVGDVLRTQDGVKPIYVSPGHLVSVEGATRCVQELPSLYRIPETFRRADQAARGHARGESGCGWIDLGELGSNPQVFSEIS